MRVSRISFLRGSFCSTSTHPSSSHSSILLSLIHPPLTHPSSTQSSILLSLIHPPLNPPSSSHSSILHSILHPLLTHPSSTQSSILLSLLHPPLIHSSFFPSCFCFHPSIPSSLYLCIHPSFIPPSFHPSISASIHSSSLHPSIPPSTDILNFLLNPPNGKVVEFVMEVTDKTRSDIKVRRR